MIWWFLFILNVIFAATSPVWHGDHSTFYVVVLTLNIVAAFVSFITLLEK